MNKEELLSQYIDDLNFNRKPGILDHIDLLDNEMLDLLETVRVVKRYSNTRVKTKWFLYWKKVMTVAVAAVLIIFISLSLNPKGDVVYAVVEAYNKLNGYKGQIVIKSFENGNLKYEEKIDVVYQKPWKYYAVHEFSGEKVKYISDGEKVTVVYPNQMEVDYLFPEKYLWHYHIGSTVWDLQNAKNINNKGTEELIGRNTNKLEYKLGKKEYVKLWIDTETKLPLKKELILANKKIVTEFKNIQINPSIADNKFTVTPENLKIREINQLCSLNLVKENYPLVEKIDKNISSELNFNKAGKITEKTFVLRYKKGENDFLDVLIMPKPENIKYLGKENKGFVQIKEGEINVFKVHLGKSNTAQWVTKDYQAIFVTSRSTQFLKDLLNNLVEKGTEFNYSVKDI